MLAPLKSRDKASEKIETDFAGDPTQIADLARSSVVAPDLASAQRAVAEVQRRFGVKPKRNALADDPPDGYRDALFIVEMGGVRAEIQVHIPAIQKAKNILHDIYDARTRIWREWQRAGKITAEQKAEIQRLNELMKEGYDAALTGNFEVARRITEAFTKARNSASEIGPPLRSTDSRENDRGGVVSQAKEMTPSGATATGTLSTSQKVVPAGNEGSVIP